MGFHLCPLPAWDPLAIEICEQQRNQARAKGVDLQLTKTAPLEINGDATRLRQMVRNVLDNAIKYTPSGGEVTVELTQTDNHKFELRVSDTGIEIPDHALGHIFDRFYRVDEARTRGAGGSGLGLSIVKQIVDTHGGTISVNSEVGSGTVVSVFLPGT